TTYITHAIAPTMILFYCLFLAIADASRFGPTLGKRLLGLRTETSRTNSKVGYLRSFCHWLLGFVLPFVSVFATLSWALTGGGWAPLGLIAFFMCLVFGLASATREKATYYDLLCGVRVRRVL